MFAKRGGDENHAGGFGRAILKWAKPWRLSDQVAVRTIVGRGEVEPSASGLVGSFVMASFSGR